MSLLAIGHEVVAIRYDDRPHEQQHEIVSHARNYAPDVIVYIGAIEEMHGIPVLEIGILKQLRDIAKTIHICGDASHKPWWPLLESYEVHGCFDVQVSIDGNFETPLAKFKSGIVKLTPIDPSLFSPKPWHERSELIAFAGNCGNPNEERAIWISQLIATTGMSWVHDSNRTWIDLYASLGNCKVSINFAKSNGTGNMFHVKGRVVETGFAGACLLERKNPHTAHWFDPNVDYFEYENLSDAVQKIEWAKENTSLLETMARKFHDRVVTEHHPSIFWKGVFER